MFIDRVTYMLSISTTCLYTLNCTFVQVTGQISIFIMSSGFRKLATSTSWAVMNGTRVGQHRRVSLYIKSHFACILNTSALFHRSCWSPINHSRNIWCVYIHEASWYVWTLSFLLSAPLSWLQVTYSRKGSFFNFGKDDSLLIPEKWQLS
jgi:hypothetical protein